MARTMDQIEDALETLGAKLYAHGDLIERLERRVQDLEAEVFDPKGFGTLEFQFCPMHQAAPAMLKALRPFAESTAWEHLDPRRQAARTGTGIDAFNRLAEPFRRAREAVAKAEGREP